jgi:hypothetical protein
VFDIYCRFFVLRLRWYVKASGRLFLRHWQWFVIAGLVVPGLPIVSLLDIPIQVFDNATLRGPGIFSHIGILAGVQLAALLWIWPQRRNLAGGSFAVYAATLPISAFVRRGVDVTLLALADILILIPAAIALSDRMRSPGEGGAYQLASLLVLVSTIFVVQLASLEKRLAALVAVGIADVLLGNGLALPLGAPAWLLLTLAFCVAIGGLVVPDWRRKSPGVYAPAETLTSARGVLRQSRWLSPSFRIQFKALAAHPVATILCLGLALCVALGADALIAIFRFDARSVPAAIVAMAAIALVISGIYRTLWSYHIPMQDFLSTLPVTRHFWSIHDTRLALLIGFVPLGIILIPLAGYQLCSPFILIVLALAYFALIATLRTALTLGGQMGVLFAAILATGWAGAGIAAVVR